MNNLFMLKEPTIPEDYGIENTLACEIDSVFLINQKKKQT